MYSDFSDVLDDERNMIIDNGLCSKACEYKVE